jgi:hypothetical protein
MRLIYWCIALTVIVMILDSVRPFTTLNKPLTPYLVGAVIVLAILAHRVTNLETATHNSDRQTETTQKPDRQTETTAVHDNSNPLRSSPSYRRLAAPLGLGSILVLITVGLVNGYSHEVVDRQERWEERETGEYDIISSGQCYFGTSGCLQFATTSYNAACVGRPLTDAGYELCQRTERALLEEISYWENCGEYCVPARIPDPGKPAWILREAPVSLLGAIPATENYLVPRVSHTERCYFNLGPIQIGSCL